MPKDSKTNKKKQKPRIDSGKPGSKSKKINDKARKSKKKTETVYLPAVIFKPPQDEPMTEHELDYVDAMLAVEMEKLAAKGLNNNQIIDALGMSRDTFYRKIKQEPYFSYCLMKHRNFANLNVESALYNRACGYTHLEKTTEAIPIKKEIDGKMQTVYEMMTAKVTEKHIPGDVKAQELWLTNRKSGEWSKNVTPSQMVANVGTINFSLKRRGE